MNNNSPERNGRIYGDARLLGDHGDNFFDQPMEDQARDQGWSEGCPVVDRLIKSPQEGGRGAEVMRNRYGRINFLMGYIAETFDQVGRTDLADWLLRPLQRNANEPLGDHDSASVPPETETLIFLTPMAYALPRIIIDYIDLYPDGKGVRMDNALFYLEKAATGNNSYDLIEVTVSFTQLILDELLLLNEKEKAGRMLRHLIGQGMLAEDNTHHFYRKIFRSIRNLAPMVRSFYSNLSPEERQDFGLVEEDELSTQLPVSNLEVIIYAGLRETRNFEVQFSPDEVDQISSIYNFLEVSFSLMAEAGSSWVRNFYYRLNFPWGSALENRMSALEGFRECIRLARDYIEFCDQQGIDDQYSQALRELKEKMVGFVRTANLD